MKEEIIRMFFGINALGALCGWAAFTVLMLSLHKDDNEKTFNLKAYAGEHWDNWLGSFVFIPTFLFLGHKGFHFEDIGINGIKWSDAYFVASGFIFELIKVAIKKWKKKEGI